MYAVRGVDEVYDESEGELAHVLVQFTFVSVVIY